MAFKMFRRFTILESPYYASAPLMVVTSEVT